MGWLPNRLPTASAVWLYIEVLPAGPGRGVVRKGTSASTVI